jgi:lambda repressor-like predicted transcriptional regulator
MDNPTSEEINALHSRRVLSTDITPGSFVRLIIAVMKRDHITKRQLAKRTGINESKIGRSLDPAHRIDVITMHTIFDALGIDILRALLAIGHFHDWEQYFDLDVEIIADLIGVLPACISKARCQHERQRIPLPGTIVLAERLSDMIANNDREVGTRRRERPLGGF